MTSSDEPRSLKSLIQSAESQRRALDTIYEATSPTYTTILDEALTLYARARQQISALGLFSPNEGVEDISTSDLPFLLVDYYVAELVQKTPNLSPAQRLDVLGQSRSAYERFLSLVDSYGLVHPPYMRFLERYRDDVEAFAVVASNDPAQKRDGKIANFKAEKELKNKLETLRRNPRYLDHGDEELVREVYLTNVTFAVHSTFSALDSLNREVPLLRQAPLPLAPSATGDIKPDISSRLDQPLRRLQSVMNGPLLNNQGKPLQPFTLVGSRSELAAGVFRPGHNLPTMSIDEYLEEEKRRGNVLQGGVEPKTVIDEDDMDAVDRETYKAREWDEFTDNNRKGAGNTMNMG
ncbi:Fc.00g088920.m01.CDS01 [Cosmosporella sp. VM-42]